MSEQQPSVCRIVMADGVPKTSNNGSEIAPAVITRVWSDSCVNVRVLCDSHDTLWWTSVRLFADARAYEAAQAEWAQSEAGQVPGAVFTGVYWPTRV